MLISSGSLCTRYCSNNLATSTDEHSLGKETMRLAGRNKMKAEEWYLIMQMFTGVYGVYVGLPAISMEKGF